MELHDYQKRAVKHLLGHPRGALFMEMGLGKTATTLSALTPDHLPALVVAPKRVAEQVWPAENQKWTPHLSLAVAAGSPAQRAAARASGADITVLGRDNLKDIPEQHPYRTVVLDELSGFKSHTSQRFKIARRLTKTTPYVWGLTGTPLPNGLMDLWAQVYLLDRGERLGTGITRYRDRYFTPGRVMPGTHIVTEWLLRPGAEARIHRSVEDICLSMSAADYLELPPVTVNDVAVPLPTARAYRTLLQDLVATVEDVLGVTATHSAASAAVLTGKLSQITAGFLYPDDPLTGTVSHLHTAKLDALQEIIDGTGSPVLVFYRFREELRRILSTVPGARHVDDPGVIRDWNAGKVPVLVAHPASAGHGLNLQHGGHTIVWTSLDWSNELYEQANARLARQGQQHPVIVHRLLSPGTVDTAIASVLERKATVQTALMDHLKGT